MTNLRYYYDQDGRLIGAWGTVRDEQGQETDHPEAPIDAIGWTLLAPEDARQLWDGDGWGEAPPLVPEFVTPLQARKALRQANLYDTVMAWIGQQDDEVQEAWEYALEIRRDNPIIAAAAAELEMTEQQVDDLFILAATL